jgi:hypothetical protein
VKQLQQLILRGSDGPGGRPTGVEERLRNELNRISLRLEERITRTENDQRGGTVFLSGMND